jgi:hypothetical protein
MERPLKMYNLSRLDPSYQLEVRRFIDAANRHTSRAKTKYIYCPCIDCKVIIIFKEVDQIKSYYIWRRRPNQFLSRALGKGPNTLGIYSLCWVPHSVKTTRQIFSRQKIFCQILCFEHSAKPFSCCVFFWHSIKKPLFAELDSASVCSRKRSAGDTTQQPSDWSSYMRW